MSAQNLDVFLRKLQSEMDRDDRKKKKGKKKSGGPSQAHRVGEVDYKATTITYREFDLMHALDSIGMSGKGGGFEVDYTHLVSDLSANMRLSFGKYAKTNRDAILSVGAEGEVTLSVLAVAKEAKSNYKTVVGLYDAEIAHFYTAFLALIDKPGGLERYSASSKNKKTGKKGQMVSMPKPGGVLVAAHDVSNIEHQVSDAVFKAMEDTNALMGKTPPSVITELENLTGNGDAQYILSIIKSGKKGEVSLAIKSYLENAQQGGGAEGEIGKKLRKAIVNLQEYLSTVEGSDSLVGSHRKKLIKELVKPFMNKKGITVKHEDFVIKENTNKSELKKAMGKLVIVGAAKRKLPIAKKAVKKKKQGRVKPPRMGLKNLLGILNAKLPEQVAANMGSPRLNSRTGRFAQSVRAVDVTETAKGFQSVGYTYARRPYGVYESTSGSRFADIDRDPRTLIDLSIREIAAQFGLGRLFTRRL